MSLGYRDLLRVVQWFWAAVNVCVHVIPHSPVPPLLTTSSRGAVSVRIFAGQVKERALRSNMQRVEPWAYTVRSLWTLNPPQ